VPTIGRKTVMPTIESPGGNSDEAEKPKMTRTEAEAAVFPHLLIYLTNCMKYCLLGSCVAERSKNKAVQFNQKSYDCINARFRQQNVG
jgi:hypothetical protein